MSDEKVIARVISTLSQRVVSIRLQPFSLHKQAHRISTVPYDGLSERRYYLDGYHKYLFLEIKRQSSHKSMLETGISLFLASQQLIVL